MDHRKPEEGGLEVTAEVPVANLDQIFPRPHPSAEFVFRLGGASLLLGAITGIPAILLARLVQREIAESAGRYAGESHARRGEFLGAVGTYGSGFLVLFALAYSWPAVAAAGAVTAAMGGLVAFVTRGQEPTQPLSALGVWLRRTPGWIAIGGVLVSAVGGFFVGQKAEESARIEAMARCDERMREAEEAKATNAFELARSSLREARTSCLGTQVEKLAAAEVDLGAKETAYKERRQKEEAERRVQAEREAAEQRKRMFEFGVDAAATALKHATDEAVRGKWTEAKEDIDKAEKSLRDVAWAEFTTEKRWRDLSAQIEPLRKRIAPGLEQQRKAEEAALARKIAADEAAIQRQEAERKRQEAAEAAREANRHVLCRDGTVSPTCLCSRASKRGCCSHHGGVAGCE
ncbi:hypothetical protein [Polyangium sp. y55x31]|uniref:hypothetical protein n=1 Tax=Polyangium sp. y55x31 TaxID=3042688 RepID=UPI002482F291|nr:hypothetical protein [Polyangium sp. y55x31]MDI1476411.1 hypothetical protein [Polyangium sp. y55x31]